MGKVCSRLSQREETHTPCEGPKKPWPFIPSDPRSDAWSIPGVEVDLKGPTGGGKQLHLVKRPEGPFKDTDFQIVETPVPSELKEGEALVQNILVSIDPTHRIWASADKQYMPSVGLNTVMRAGTIGKVVKSSNEEKMKVGTYVSGFGGVQDYVVAPIATLNPVVPGVPLSYNHSLFSGVIGLTAWVGSNICEPKAGKMVVISGAAGAVGSVAAQVCKNRGANVVGIAGSKEKCGWLINELGLDSVINYKTDDVDAKLKDLCPKGVDAYFDNVGGKITESVFRHLNNFANVAFCGCISGYNDAKGQTATMSEYQMLLMRRVKMQGFICGDHVAQIGDCIAELAGYLQAGKMKFNEDVQEVPISDYVRIVNKLYTGENTGKLMMKINPE